jgi:hypothetical protein
MLGFRRCGHYFRAYQVRGSYLNEAGKVHDPLDLAASKKAFSGAIHRVPKDVSQVTKKAVEQVACNSAQLDVPSQLRRAFGQGIRTFLMHMDPRSPAVAENKFRGGDVLTPISKGGPLVPDHSE